MISVIICISMILESHVLAGSVESFSVEDSTILDTQNNKHQPVHTALSRISVKDVKNGKAGEDPVRNLGLGSGDIASRSSNGTAGQGGALTDLSPEDRRSLRELAGKALSLVKDWVTKNKNVGNTTQPEEDSSQSHSCDKNGKACQEEAKKKKDKKASKREQPDTVALLDREGARKLIYTVLKFLLYTTVGKSLVKYFPVLIKWFVRIYNLLPSPVQHTANYVCEIWSYGDDRNIVISNFSNVAETAIGSAAKAIDDTCREILRR